MPYGYLLAGTHWVVKATAMPGLYRLTYGKHKGYMEA